MPQEMPDDISLEKLVARERDLVRRKDELARREEEVSLALQRTMPNFPPKFLCIRPLVYHSIISEVPSDRVRYVRIAYVTYYLTVLTLIYNLVCAVVGFVATDSGGSSHEWGAHLGTSVVYLLGIPGAFVVWYFPIYTAASTGDGYGVAFIGTGVGFVFSVFALVGVMSYGGCGVLYTLAALTSREGSTPWIMALVCTVLWGIQVLFFCGSFLVLRWMRKEDALRDREATAAVARTLGDGPHPA